MPDPGVTPVQRQGYPSEQALHRKKLHSNALTTANTLSLVAKYLAAEFPLQLTEEFLQQRLLPSTFSECSKPFSCNGCID